MNPPLQKRSRWSYVRELGDPAKVALFVGTTLCLINHTFTSGSPSRIALNYVVPFLVSSYSRFSLQRKLAGAAKEPKPTDRSGDRP